MADAVDNHELVAQFMPEQDDGDTFIYTELLDRSKRTQGNNRVRMLKTFHHGSREQFLKTWPVIKELCRATNVRAYTRLSPRSYAKVGRIYASLVVEAALEQRFQGMRYLYSRACGRVVPSEKRWLFDFDDDAGPAYAALLAPAGLHLATIPSRSGCHVITKPFDLRLFPQPAGVSLHKDNPTNLFIPDGAA
jgi:hypothetical protein